MSAVELAKFHEMPGSKLALMLRRCDDLAKDAGGPDVPTLESYRAAIYEHLQGQASAATPK